MKVQMRVAEVVRIRINNGNSLVFILCFSAPPGSHCCQMFPVPPGSSGCQVSGGRNHLLFGLSGDAEVVSLRNDAD